MFHIQPVDDINYAPFTGGAITTAFYGGTTDEYGVDGTFITIPVHWSYIQFRIANYLCIRYKHGNNDWLEWIVIHFN